VITLSVCLYLILLALIAAIFSQQHSDWVLDTDRDKYFPPFLKSEGFYRAFLINLSFAGISTAATAIQHVKYTSFLTLCDPLLAILLNLSLGLFAALSLSAETKPFKRRERRLWTTCLVIIGGMCFAIAVWTTVQLAGPKGQLLGATHREAVFTFSQVPSDDAALKSWLAKQPDIHNVILSREDRQITVGYDRATPILGPSIAEFKTMGYEEPTPVDVDLANRPLGWWLVHAPTNAWMTFVIATLIAALVLSWGWRAIGGGSTSAAQAGPQLPVGGGAAAPGGNGPHIGGAPQGPG
jgi:hypothetical protein